MPHISNNHHLSSHQSHFLTTRNPALSWSSINSNNSRNNTNYLTSSSNSAILNYNCNYKLSTPNVSSLSSLLMSSVHQNADSQSKQHYEDDNAKCEMTRGLSEDNFANIKNSKQKDNGLMNKCIYQQNQDSYTHVSSTRAQVQQCKQSLTNRIRRGRDGNHDDEQFSIIGQQQSLFHLQQTQQQLHLLKHYLELAYQKLQKEILHSIQLQNRIDELSHQLQQKQEMVRMQHQQNEKLKFTLKAVMKNRCQLETLQQQIKDAKTNPLKRRNHQQDQQLYYEKEQQFADLSLNTQILYKQNLKLKLTVKQLQQNVKQLQQDMKQLQQNNYQLQQNTCQLQQNTQERLSAIIEQHRTKQQHLLSRISALQLQLKKVTDEKIVAVNRLRHQLVVMQSQNDQFLKQNQVCKCDQGRGEVTHQINHKKLLTATSIQATHTNSANQSITNNAKLGNNKESNNNIIARTLILDSQQDENTSIEQQLSRNTNQSHNRKQSLHRINSSIRENNNNKQNIQSQNVQQKLLKIASKMEMEQSQCTGAATLTNKPKTVGKWKRGQTSVSASGNSSTCFESIESNCELQGNLPQTHQNVELQPKSSAQTMKQPPTNLPQTQSEDQKLTKYQQHRRNIQNELSSLQKIKRPTKEERERIQKLQKQLYYLDSDIAGLKRKIRRRY